MYVFLCIIYDILFLVDQVGKKSTTLVHHNPERTAKLELAGLKELLKNI